MHDPTNCGPIVCVPPCAEPLRAVHSMAMDPLRELSQSVRRLVVGRGREATWRHERLRLKLAVVSSPEEPRHDVYEPVFALVVQGEKQLVLGDALFTCGAGTFMVVSVDLPIAFQVTHASPAAPYIALTMGLRPAEIASLLLESATVELAPTVDAPAGLGVSQASTELLDAVVRLVRLVERPGDLEVLGPLVEKEILWRVLCSEQGQRLRQIGLADSRLSRIGRAMRWMRDNYDQGWRIESLARQAAMSVTSFHRHFRAVALMSPLQYQKRIRLQEARRRLLAGVEDVGAIGLSVGYDSASQFSREYKRAFGAPPGEDARRLRASSRVAGAARRAQSSK